MQRDNGGNAFPSRYTNDGMSLRDWFAGMALSSLCATVESLCGNVNPDQFIDGDGDELGQKIMAERSYQLADAMLKARGE